MSREGANVLGLAPHYRRVVIPATLAPCFATSHNHILPPLLLHHIFCISKRKAMSTAYTSMRDAYARVQEAYNDLGTADQKSIRLRYAAFCGGLIGFLMCMRFPAVGIPVSGILPYHLLCTSHSLPLAPPTVYLVRYSYSKRSRKFCCQSDCQHYI